MAPSSPSPPSGDRPRHYLRYSLRALLIFFTLACVGVWYWYRVPYAKEVLHSKGVALWKEKSQWVLLAKQVERYRRVLRGEPIREGLTELFDGEGHRLGEEHWREGKLHGRWTRWYSTGQIQEQGNYDLGRRQGIWERFDEEGGLSVRMPFNNGDPHGDWEWFEKGKPVRTIRFDHVEVTQIDGREVDDPLGRAYRLGKVDDSRIGDMLRVFAECDFSNTPLKDAVGFVANNYRINISLDKRSLSGAGFQEDTPINLRADRITGGALLLLLFEPHDFAATYRFGMIWITTKDNAKNWVDRTGVSKLLDSPPPGALAAHRDKVRAALQQRAEFDFVDTPIRDVARFLSEVYRINFVCERTAPDLAVNSNLRGISLQNALGAMCDNSGLHVRWEGATTLVIEPREGTNEHP